MKHFFSFCLFFLFFFSCTSTGDMPRFVSIFKGEIENVKLSSYTQEKNNDVLINFDKNIKDISCSAFYDEEELEEIPCSVKQVKEEDEKHFVVSLGSGQENCKIDIGQSYYIKGEVKDKWGNSLLFFLPLVGANITPATLKISEVRPLYSKKPKGEFIEMIVTKEGNLSGIKLSNVGSKKEPDYIFPPAYVKKGEIIVYHWRSFDEETQDETDASIVSRGSGASRTARDFWGKHKSLPKRKNNAILIEESGNVQDAILYFDPKTDADDWSSEEIANAATKAFESGIWLPSDNIKDAIRYHITPSCSVGRRIMPKDNKSSAKQYVLYKSKFVTEGRKNR